ncbi:MAG: glycerol-3-phosphate acyltransferase [Actinomycetota bacterium]
MSRRRVSRRSPVAAAAVGYLLGTIPSADIAARLATGGHVDLRSSGSGNPGGANAKNVLGARWGYAVMAGDIGKGAFACVAGRALAGDVGAHIGGTASVIGHCFPVWSGFRGGKGVGCSVGQCAITFPAYFPIDLGVAAATAAGPWRSRALAATATASATWVGAGYLWWRRGWTNLWGPRPSVALPLAAAASSAVILYKFASARTPR